MREELKTLGCGVCGGDRLWTRGEPLACSFCGSRETAIRYLTTADAPRAWAVGRLRLLAEWIGLGFHPDTADAEYVDAGGQRVFSDREAAEIDAAVSDCRKLLGDGVYDVGLDELHRLAAAAAD